MKLRRSFIDVKRLATISVNYHIRRKWLLDYIKAAVKPLEFININNITLFNKLSKYVLFNGQKLSLKTFVDDRHDLIDRRTVIEESSETSYSFYGYNIESDTFILEVDPNPDTFNGYIDVIDGKLIYTLEDEIENNDPLYGLNRFNPGIYALQDVVEAYILNKYFDYIYTSEDASSGLKYMWFSEGKFNEGLVIYLHGSIYDLMTDVELEELYNILSKYIIQPISYKIDRL